MATTSPTISDDYVQEQYEKDIQIIAYGAMRATYDTAREFVAEALGDEIEDDLFEKEINERTKVRVVFNITGTRENYAGEEIDHEFEEAIEPWGSTDKEFVAEFFRGMDEEDLPDWIEFEEETIRESEYVHSEKGAIADIIENAVGDVEIEDLGYQEPNWAAYPVSFQREVDDLSVDADPDDMITQYVRVQSPPSHRIEPRRRLLHQDERSQHKKFEDSGDEFWSFPVDVHLEASSSDELDELSERFVPQLYKALAQLPMITSVRLSECEQQVKSAGACYNI